MADVVGVVGAGLMGAGIAQVAAQAGYGSASTTSTRPRWSAVSQGISASVGKLVAKGLVTEDLDTVLGRITATTELDRLADATIAVEAVFERLEVKQGVFRALDAVLSPEAILATNTSALPITQLAAVTSRPGQVVGTHFFSPVPLMQLCELVRGSETTDSTLATARAFAERVGQDRVWSSTATWPASSRPGSITALVVEAARLVESGVASAEDVDTACRLGFGHPMGPLETMDLIGIDVMVSAADNIAAETPGETFSAPELLREMVAAGALGRKTGQGFYRY